MHVIFTRLKVCTLLQFWMFVTVHRNVMIVAEVFYEVGNAGAFHWSQGIKQNVALIFHHHVFHTFYVFCRNTQATLTLNISGHFHIFWMPLFEHFMCSGKMACSLQWLSNINACPVYWFWNLFKILTKYNFLLALICLFARMSSVLWLGHMFHLKDFVEFHV
jgi:hypothetical protein